VRFLADHNVEAPIVSRLRESGHDVLAVAEAMPPETEDTLVLKRARDEDRVLITNDKDFGELAYLQGEASAGLVLLRLPDLGGAAKAARALEALTLLDERARGAFVVITKTRIRRRPLPARRGDRKWLF
jgi:predicted nuclease of predicted toxin-antitoxin system